MINMYAIEKAAELEAVRRKGMDVSAYVGQVRAARRRPFPAAIVGAVGRAMTRVGTGIESWAGSRATATE